MPASPFHTFSNHHQIIHKYEKTETFPYPALGRAVLNYGFGRDGQLQSERQRPSKAIFFDQMLHAFIILMSVDSNVWFELFTKS